MDIIQVSKDQFQMITILLKYLTSNTNLKQLNDSFFVDTMDFKTFLFKKVVLPIEIKNHLYKNFDIILDSIANLNHKLFTMNEENSKLIITKDQICSLIKPIITDAAINPLDKQKLNVFFKKFSCQAGQNEFFLELI